MVYIYKKSSGDKSYYYLRASERRGSRIIAKDIAYLGTSIEEVKKSLDNLPKYSKEIRKAYKTLNNFLESNIFLERTKTLKLKKDEFLGESLFEVEACKLHYDKVFKNKDQITKQEILKNFIIEFAFNTASIEGNTIKLKEARNLLQEGIVPKNKNLREIYDLQNTEKVFFELLNSKKEINHDLIISIHKELIENIDKRTGYRTEDVRVIKTNFKATPAPYVKIDMNLLLEWYNKNKHKLHPFVLAIVFHHKFEKIHPFMDGNGRTGRMLMNYILIKNDYPPFIIHNSSRKRYLSSLNSADKADPLKIPKDDYRDLINFGTEEMIKTYWNIFL
ncbi:MAG: Fic family protein [Candidatus Woesearchaeota archaeon]